MRLRQFREFYFRNRFECDLWFSVKVKTKTSKKILNLYGCKGQILDSEVIDVKHNLISVNF